MASDADQFVVAAVLFLVPVVLRSLYQYCAEVHRVAAKLRFFCEVLVTCSGIVECLTFWGFWLLSWSIQL